VDVGVPETVWLVVPEGETAGPDVAAAEVAFAAAVVFPATGDEPLTAAVVFPATGDEPFTAAVVFPATGDEPLTAAVVFPATGDEPFKAIVVFRATVLFKAIDVPLAAEIDETFCE